MEAHAWIDPVGHQYVSKSKYARLRIYNYFSVQEQATKLALLSKAERQLIKESHILSENGERVVELYLPKTQKTRLPLSKHAWLLKFATSLKIYADLNNEAEAEVAGLVIT